MIKLHIKDLLPELILRESNFVLATPASGVTIDLKANVYVMWILNMSHDSFYVGYSDVKEALKAAERAVEDGADIIDVGGQSSRPGADEIPLEEEIKRVAVIGELRRLFPKLPISVDTYRSEVARFAFDLGADILNDISGFRFDPRVLDVCTAYGAPAIAMHITAKPKVMQENTIEDDSMVVDVVRNYLLRSAEKAERKGIKVVIDPGIGFGKKPYQNLKIINKIDELVKTGYPVLLGASRKSFISFCISSENPPPPAERLEGTLATSVIGLLKGVRIFRVHDVRENIRALRVAASVATERFIS